MKTDKYLSINCGSSSVKASLFHTDGESLKLIQDKHLKGKDFKNDSLSLRESLRAIFDGFQHQDPHIFEGLKGIGHRFVHGGPHYLTSVKVDQEVIENLKAVNELAPLHNPICLEGIVFSQDYFKSIPQLIVFDTAFHQTLPQVASDYALPRDLTRKYAIHRYGFHGIAHQFLWETYAKSSQNPHRNSKVITLQLGNGCSIAAIRNGQSVDTSMGFTPTAGLIMGTRAGDIDASIVEFLAKHEKKSTEQVMEIVNAKSGLLGISDFTADMKELQRCYQEKAEAKLAIDMFCYRIVKYIGAYIFVLNGVEAIIFSGGIGENSATIRQQVIDTLAWYGLKIDSALNNKACGLSPGEIRLISPSDSSVAIYVIAADENLFIAQEVRKMML